MGFKIHWATAEDFQRGTPQRLRMRANTKAEAIEQLHEHSQEAAVRDLLAGAGEDRYTTRVWLTTDDDPREIAGFNTATPFHPLPSVFPSPAPFNETWAHIYAQIP